MRNLCITEATIAKMVIDAILAEGYSISVWEGGGWAIEGSKDQEAIYNSLASTESDALHIWDGPNNIGWVWLVYGSGEVLITDYSANEIVEAIIQPIMDAIDSGNY